MIWPFAPLTPFKYGAILADPPWAYAMRSAAGHAKSPEAHYATLDLDTIKALPVAGLAGPNCYLFLWSTWPHLMMAGDVLEAWGFSYVTGGSWLKRTVNWNVAMGTGYVMRSSTEPYLIGKIGRPQVASRSERNVILAPDEVVTLAPWDIPDSIEAIRREHSRKPVEMREMIDRLLPRQYFCEIFAREPWAGHEVWGNQTDHFGVADDV